MVASLHLLHEMIVRLYTHEVDVAFEKKHDETIDVALFAPQGITTMRTNSLFPKLGIKKEARSLWY